MSDSTALTTKNVFSSLTSEIDSFCYCFSCRKTMDDPAEMMLICEPSGENCSVADSKMRGCVQCKDCSIKGKHRSNTADPNSYRLHCKVCKLRATAHVLKCQEKGEQPKRSIAGLIHKPNVCLARFQQAAGAGCLTAIGGLVSEGRQVVQRDEAQHAQEKRKAEVATEALTTKVRRLEQENSALREGAPAPEAAEAAEAAAPEAAVSAEEAERRNQESAARNDAAAAEYDARAAEAERRAMAPAEEEWQDGYEAAAEAAEAPDEDPFAPEGGGNEAAAAAEAGAVQPAAEEDAESMVGSERGERAADSEPEDELPLNQRPAAKKSKGANGGKGSRAARRSEALPATPATPAADPEEAEPEPLLSVRGKEKKLAYQQHRREGGSNAEWLQMQEEEKAAEKAEKAAQKAREKKMIAEYDGLKAKLIEVQDEAQKEREDKQEKVKVLKAMKKQKATFIKWLIEEQCMDAKAIQDFWEEAEA